MTSILSPYQGRWPKGRRRHHMYHSNGADQKLATMPPVIQFLLVVFVVPVAEEILFRAPILLIPAEIQISAAVVLGIAFLLTHLIFAFGGQVGHFIVAVPYLSCVTVATSAMVMYQGALGVWYAVLLHVGLNALMVVEFWCQRTMQRSLIAELREGSRAFLALSDPNLRRKKK